MRPLFAGAFAIEAIAVDHPDVLALIAASDVESAARYAPEHRFASSVAELLASKAFFALARDADGMALGGSGFARRDDYGELKRIFTLPAARGRGVGRAIVAALEAEARRRGMTRMLLETGRESSDALALYRRCGYRERGPFGPYVDNGSSVFMERAIS
ncbi:MAG: GNAT family N-acetyltransferase [Pacificimonas sp.]|nr:GNAT family N-acetyltransferase [Pacificimonas sp.]